MLPVARGSVVDELVARILADVLGGTYAPGTYLPPERELAQGYGVTRTSLKHAFVRLTQAGLLETRHGVGTVVRDYERLGDPALLPLLVQSSGAGWLTEIFEVRREVGGLVAARAAVNASAGHRTRLRALHAEVAGAADGDAAQLAECELHRCLAEAAGNRVYVLMVNALLNAYLPVRGFLAEPFADPVAAAERLRPMVDAVCAGDASDAHTAAVGYLTETERLMLGSVAGADA